MKLMICSFIVLFGFSSATFASEGHSESPSEETESRFGPGKAIEAFDKEQGFKLSSKSAAAMGVSFQRLDHAGPWRVPRGAIIQLKQSTGIYRKYDGWISMVLVKIVKRDGDTLLITTEDLESGDEVAISGATFLRMTDADLNSGTVDSCAH
jgi:hypothetical protein